MSDTDDLTVLGKRTAHVIHAAYRRFQSEFNKITKRSPYRFKTRDWRGAQDDAVERLDLYANTLDGAVAELKQLLGEASTDESLWGLIRESYAAAVAHERNRELAETFFNSITRRRFATVGVNPAIEFLAHGDPTGGRVAEPGLHRFEHAACSADLLEQILLRYFAVAEWEQIERDTQLAAQAIVDYLRTTLESDHVESIEMLRPLFFRDRVGYAVGRVHCANNVVPLVLVLRSNARGVYVDAVLLNEDEVSILFSFSRSYFHVDVRSPKRTISFLRTIMPRKPVAELYTTLGLNRHGKTALYRDLMHHLDSSPDRFELAPGDRGLVMIVFTLPTYDVVFKVIRDRFDYPKTTSRRTVLDRYHLVFNRDRVGRLVDAQPFEHLTFRRDRFSEPLLEELLGEAASSVSVRGDEIAISHLYTERKVVPLNVYLRQSLEDAAILAVVDYGHAIRELAEANIFPGDFLLKNFGVTRHGRVVFYDYDELCLVTDCNFRELPAARNPEDELSPEPWFSVGENDIFPEEFRRFLGMSPQLREIFESHHHDLFDPEWWRSLQRLQEGDAAPDVFPYPAHRRLRGF